MIVSYYVTGAYFGFCTWYGAVHMRTVGASDCEWIVPGTIDHEGNSLCDPRYSGL